MKTKTLATSRVGTRNGSEFKCDKCDRSFGNAQGLALHKRRAHEGMGMQKGDAQEKPKITRRKKAQGPEVRYCPCCGTDMLALSVALTVASKR